MKATERLSTRATQFLNALGISLMARILFEFPDRHREVIVLPVVVDPLGHRPSMFLPVRQNDPPMCPIRSSTPRSSSETEKARSSARALSRLRRGFGIGRWLNDD